MTPREELQEALAKAYELLEEIKAEETKASEARAVYNTMVNELDLKAIEDAVAEEIAAKEQELQEKFEAAIAKAQATLDAALKRFYDAKDRAASVFNTALEEYTAERHKYFLEIKAEYETRLAEGEMTVHAAKQQVQNAENSFNRHCDNFKAQRGPDIKALIDAMMAVNPEA